MRRAGARRVGHAAWACCGALCAMGAEACHKDPIVTTREVTLHAPQSCAPGVPSLDGRAYGIYHPLGDFEPPPAATGHVLGDLGATLPELNPAALALLVDATEGDRDWQGETNIPAAGAVDVLLLPASTSCALRGPFDAGTARAGPSLAPIGGERLLIVGGVASSPPPTLVVRLDTGEADSVSPDLLTPRARASVTAFGTGALVAGGIDSRTGTTVLDKAEVYEPELGGFDQQHPIALSTQRADHGAVVLVTGETLLVGGVGGDGKTALDSMEIVDPVTRTVRPENVARLAVARRSPAVLRLASGEILVAGGVDTNGNQVLAIEWFSSDVTRTTKLTQDLVGGPVRAFVALDAGGALAVISPPPGASSTFQNTWLIDADGVFEPGIPVAGSLSEPMLFGAAGNAPVLWTGDRWLRWAPWTGSFGALDVLDDQPARVGNVAASPDPGLAVWLDAKDGALTALRFDTRGVYSTLAGPLLVSDTTDVAPDRLASNGVVTFDPSVGLILGAGASAFVVDRTYADIDVELDAPTGEPALLVLRDQLGNELEVGGVGCPGDLVAGPPSSLTVQRRGAKVTWTLTGNAPQTCPTAILPDARVSVGIRGSAELSRSVARNLRITRAGQP